MEDLISRQAVFDLLFNSYIKTELTSIGYASKEYAELCVDELNELPPVTQKSETVTEFADRCRECGREKVLNKITDEVYDIDDMIILNPDNLFERKSYVRLNTVIDIIDKYKAESEG